MLSVIGDDNEEELTVLRKQKNEPNRTYKERIKKNR
jgi:hypothetical protein